MEGPTLLQMAGRLLPLKSIALQKWRGMDVPQRFRLGCEMWSDSGFGTPVVVHSFYILKISLYLWLLLFFLSFSDLHCCGSEEKSGGGVIKWWQGDAEEVPGRGGARPSPLTEERAAWFIDGFQRFVTLSLAFEGLGLGCGSGPLSAHFLPPFTAAWHWFHPGTIKLPWRLDLRDGRHAAFGLSPSSYLGGTERGVGACLFNALHFAFLLRALIAPRASAVGVLLPFCFTLAVLAVSDVALFLASRSEHYLTLTLCTVIAASAHHAASTSSNLADGGGVGFFTSFLAADLVGGGRGDGAAAAAALTGWKVVQLGIWLWAAVSKWGRFFVNVIQVMASNSPLVALVYPASLQKWLRSALYKDLANGDFRPSNAAAGLATFGTCAEIAFPLLLMCGGRLGVAGLVVGVGFHIFILSNVAIGVPQEWNVFCISAACFLFGPTMDPLDFTSHGGWAAALAIFAKAPVAETAVELAGFAGLQLGDVLSLPLALLVVLATSEVLVPLIGNISPKRASFLASRRYYAGNWAGGVWLVRKSAWHKLSRIKTLSSPITDQLRSIYGESEVEAAVARLMGFRVMHLNSRILPRALSLAVSRATGTTHGGRSKPKPLFSDYQYMDGEFIAAWALGYNFGDGYLHGPFMLQAVQDKCQFTEGECLLVHWDSLPIWSDALEWFARDATDIWNSENFIVHGVESARVLSERQPFDAHELEGEGGKPMAQKRKAE